MVHNQLTGLQKLYEYRARRAHVFPSGNALQWFVRQHRARLVEAGALIMLTGQWHVVEDKFDAVVIQVGREAAQRHAGARAI